MKLGQRSLLLVLVLVIMLQLYLLVGPTPKIDIFVPPVSEPHSEANTIKMSSTPPPSPSVSSSSPSPSSILTNVTPLHSLYPSLTTLSTLWKKSTGPSWPLEFCQSFLGKTYDRTSVVYQNRITCRGSQYSKKMGTCIMRGGVAVRPKPLYDVMAVLKIEKILNSQSLWLLGQDLSQQPLFRDAELYMEKYDPILPIIKMSTLSSQASRNSSCQKWINGTTFFYIGMAKHIYFRFLSWYNLFRSLREHEEERANINIVRLPEIEGEFLFPELERNLFGNVIPIETLKEDVVCFETIVLVSWAYGAPLFRCKMDGATTKRKCLKCEGKNLNTDLVIFREHVLSACSIQDRTSDYRETKTITVIERKRYERFEGDSQKKFNRIWTNSAELILQLRETFPHINVTGVYTEDLPICDQIRLVHNTDLLIAMHGAGLVHLLWQQENAKVLEIVPKSQRGNAAFITLAKHIGRTHKTMNRVKEKSAIVTVDINKVIEEVKTLL